MSDSYIAEKTKIFSMADRKLKIHSKHRALSSSYYGRIVPELRLCGVWLERSGFKVGEQVQLTIKDQEIIIKPACASTYAEASAVRKATADEPMR